MEELVYRVFLDNGFSSLNRREFSVSYRTLYHMAQQGYLVRQDLPEYVTLTEVGEERAYLYVNSN
ncbi:MAG: hypothetical protein ACK518_01695 [bacterium]|jgi:hypothetical protein